MIEFAYPAALWTASAVGLPILAHMAFRRVTRKYPFPSLRFIRPSRIPRTGRKKPTDLLLLLLRILFFLTLSALLADPYWTPESSPNAKKEAGKETLLAIDVSPSMEGWHGLEEARSLALRLIEEEEGKVGLVAFGRNIFGEWKPGVGKEELSVAIKGLGHDWKKGNAQVLLDRATGLFSSSATEKKLVVISDFQQSDWQTAFRNLPELGVKVDLRRVGTGEGQGKRSGNLSVVEARAVPAGPGKVRVWTVIRNWDDEPKTVSLTLSAGGEIRQRQEVVLPRLGSAQAQFVLKSDDFSGASVELESGDSFALDDKRSLWLKSPPTRRFGFWMPEAEDAETREERDFLKTAVSSAGDNGWNRWDWAQDQADGLRLGDEQSSLELLLVIGLGGWFGEQELGPALQGFLEGGGTALLTPGQPFVKTATVIRDAELFPFKFLRVAGGAVRLGNPFRIKALDEGSFLNAVFDGKAARDLYLSAIHRFGIIQQVGEGVDVPIRDREGRPLALVRDLDGGGRVVFLPFRMNTSWTDLPMRNSFLPLLMELSFGNRETMPSRAWPVLEPGGTWGEGEQVFKAVEPGVFRFEDQWLEVVPSLAESVPEVLSSDELLQSMGGEFSSYRASGQEEGSGKEEREPLWLWFAIVAASLLIIEMIWSRPARGAITKGDSAHA
jgi:hypothetical protein